MRCELGRHILPDFRKMTCFLFAHMKRADPKASPSIFGSKIRLFPYFFRDSSTATARSTVIPTMGSDPTAAGGGGREGSEWQRSKFRERIANRKFRVPQQGERPDRRQGAVVER